MKLRNKILSYTLPLILIPFLLTAIAVYYFLIRTGQERSKQEQRQNVGEIVLRVGNEVDLIRREIGLLSSVPDVIEFLRQTKVKNNSLQINSLPRFEQTKTTLEIFFKQNRNYLELSLLDKTGKETIKFSRFSEKPKLKNLKSEGFYNRSLISGAVQTPAYKFSDGRYATTFTRNVFDKEYLGMVLVTLDTRMFEATMLPLLKRDLSSFLVDDRGIVLSSSVESNLVDWLEKTRFSGDVKELMSDGRFDELKREVFAGGKNYVLSFVPSESLFSHGTIEKPPGSNWFLGVIEPTGKNAVPVNIQLLFLSILALAVLAILLTSAKAASRITIPLEKVSDATARIAKGNSRLSLDVETGDEVEDLANAVTKMNSDLVEYQKQLIQSTKLATMGEMTSQISHEIQNRISGISLWLQHLDSEIAEGDAKREYVDEMKLGLFGFMEMLKDLKRYYRKPLLDLASTSPNSLISEALPYVRDKMAEKKIELEVDLSDNLPEINCDKEKITGVLLNLFVNAIDAVEVGGKITIKSGKNAVDNEVYFEFTDSGNGIPEADLTRVFSPYYSTKSGGSGLGLAIASNIISAHRGRIDAENGLSGAIFTVSLPADTDV